MNSRLELMRMAINAIRNEILTRKFWFLWYKIMDFHWVFDGRWQQPQLCIMSCHGLLSYGVEDIEASTTK